MGERSADLAKRLEQTVAEFGEAVSKQSDAQWKATCGDEGWTVAATAQHVAGQFPLEREYIVAAAEGSAPPARTWAELNGANDRRAAANTSASKAEVLVQLREGGASMAAYIRGLSDEQLDRTAPLVLADGAAVSTKDLIEGGVLIGHLEGHLKSIAAAQ